MNYTGGFFKCHITVHGFAKRWTLKKTDVQLKTKNKMENKNSNLEQTPPFCKTDVIGRHGLFHGNAMDLICDLDDHSIDLTILDPDYQDWDKLCEEGLICQAVRVTKLTGNIICFTKQPFDYNLRNEVNHIFRREIIWSFSNGGAWVSKRMPLVSFQKIFWLTLSKDFYVDVRTGLDYNEGTKSMKRSSKVFGDYKAEGRQFDKSDEGTWIRDHYHFNKPHTGKIPSKPKDLIQILIKCFCPENGIVLDPFFGSGIVGDVCQKLNRNFIAYEIDEQRVKMFNDKQGANAFR